MEALALAAALLTADTEVRRSEAFALAGELGRFPAREAVEREREQAQAHFEWLQNQLPAGPLGAWVIPEDLTEQRQVIEVYDKLRDARSYIATAFNTPTASEAEWCGEHFEFPAAYLGYARDFAARIRQLIGDDDYHAGRLPAPVTVLRRPG